MFNQKISFVCLAFILAFCCLPVSIWAVNSTNLDISATVNSSLAISVSDIGAQSFDPSVSNSAVKVGLLTITANVANGINLTIFQSNAGVIDFSKTSDMVLTRVGGVALNTYTLNLVSLNGGPDLSGTKYTKYSDSASLVGVSDFANKMYDILLSTDAVLAPIPDGRYKDSIIFSLSAL